MSQQRWLDQAEQVAEIHNDLRHQHGRGPCNIFILDTSSSLGLEGFEQMKAVFTTIIDEFASHSEFDENVAVIVCGRFTRFQHYLSNRYADIKHCLDDVEFGGASQLTGAFFLTRGCMLKCYSEGCVIGDFHIYPRIILISDGRPTDFTETNTSDDCPQNETENDKNQLLQLTANIGRRYPIFCIPVGRNPDMTVLEFISGQSRGGKIVYPAQAKQFAKCSQNVKTASNLIYTMLNDGNDRERILICLATTYPHRNFTEMDQADIIEICTKKYIYQTLEDTLEDSCIINDVHSAGRDPLLLPVGSRVRRGRDWEWGDQDNFGAGTVVRHPKSGWLVVKWDNGFTTNYRYGSSHGNMNKYDVEVCEEPRALNNELIAEGCVVKRGPNWEWGDQDCGEDNLGSVIYVQKDGAVQ
nr:uncharacterized protein LOC111128668 isoform X2 [Crassostrea virginica]